MASRFAMPKCFHSMKVLITGANGQLGRALAAVATSRYQLLLADRARLDLADPDSIESFMRTENPDVVINAAAYTAVDKAESDSALAQRVNAVAPGVVSESAKAIGAFMVHISTDFVFDGKSSVPYRPTDPTAPLSVYGLTKRDGETAVTKVLPKTSYLIMRTAWVYSESGNNFVKTMLRLMRERESVGVVGDQIGTPTWARSLAGAIWLAIEKRLSGVHHWTDAGTASWYDFAVAIQEEAMALGMVAREVEVRQIATADYLTPARRPAFSVLDKTATWSALGHQPPHWRQQLRLMLRELNQKNAAT